MIPLGMLDLKFADPFICLLACWIQAALAVYIFETDIFCSAVEQEEKKKCKQGRKWISVPISSWAPVSDPKRMANPMLNKLMFLEVRQGYLQHRRRRQLYLSAHEVLIRLLHLRFSFRHTWVWFELNRIAVFDVTWFSVKIKIGDLWKVFGAGIPDHFQFNFNRWLKGYASFTKWFILRFVHIWRDLLRQLSFTECRSDHGLGAYHTTNIIFCLFLILKIETCLQISLSGSVMIPLFRKTWTYCYRWTHAHNLSCKIWQFIMILLQVSECGGGCLSYLQHNVSQQQSDIIYSSQ